MKASVNEKYQYVFEEELLKEIEAIGFYKKVDAEVTMIDFGDKIEHMPLVLQGAIKILREDKEGNELLLYYLEVGDTCAMTMTCCIGGKKSNIRAVTEQKTELILVPVGKMEEWLIQFKSWRRFVFDNYNVRLDEMLDAVDTLAFHNMEDRLYKYLENKAMVLGSAQLNITHYQIANELNSSRVVISRLMKKLNDRGKIKHHRNRVEVVKFLPSE